MAHLVTSEGEPLRVPPSDVRPISSASLPPLLGRGRNPRPATEGSYPLGSPDDRLPASRRRAYSPVVVADTDVVLDFFTDTEPFAQVLAGLMGEERLAITAITAFELYAGVIGAKRLRQVEILCEALPVIPVDLLASAYAGRIYTDLKSRGITIGNQDILIAGVCLANELQLVTRNAAHFKAIRGLELFRG